MNLGQAVAVCLYELIRSDRVGWSLREDTARSSVEVERMTAILLDVSEHQHSHEPGPGSCHRGTGAAHGSPAQGIRP